ncbi:DUF4625 domain-containing protein [Sinomicrobium weinanense]|uniref:DUF4625 domain-containing protein n=1 Tax=Sinomicrobium weinanense TaxID=2842200 RepID=A0A926JTU5_9FLAO|nr:DUF4625 domain-containing protein [Sinomicrobium weinanense]MBC9797204.1 DUF4625 domain-containing protein [Sinomicrobium weinanense]MBU3122732.1 DUF4625 domain-containing protein [Sinomicrobium weinanense]
MTLKTKVLYLLPMALIWNSCSDDDTVVDDEKPTITVAYENGFPTPCTGLQRGGTYTIRARVSDNDALAAYSIDIHHNFDHHTHDDQGASCELAPLKQAVDPFIYMQNFQIEGNPGTYEINREITIPENIDTGDYHCQLSVTDRTGWQSRTSIDIKVIE